MRTYNYTAQGKKSALKGLSPEATYRKHVEAGWAPTAMSRDEVRAACARTEERSVVQGAISVGGRHWTCPELQAYQYEKIWVRVPAYPTPAELLLLDRHGERVGIGAEHNVEGADAYDAIVIYGENTSLRALCHLVQNCAASTSGIGSIRLPRIETTLRGMSCGSGALKLLHERRDELRSQA
ncbi:hypothetical protein [Mesorhizobium sp. ES1-4]|uniref:hypothetical protein n=1 Tax=Mesorhizobium sp. ES1-4 TaxID=2876627 RepID=UPI001CCCDEEC|nr:hypothetical protein [Mesorhizobium sp. ES1-4]MBZ9799135.1 hypothetical protein [Mesorhizobium sp. ES1-4]